MKWLGVIGLTAYAAALLAGCASSSSSSSSALVPNNPSYAGMTQAQINNQVQTSLATAASQAQNSLAELSAINKMRFQTDNSMPLGDVTDPALNQVVTIKWYGPIGPLLSQVASLTGYQFETFGKPPFSPILVNVDDTDNPTTAIGIIRNVDVQAGLNAQIIVFQNQKIISLRYVGS